MCTKSCFINWTFLVYIFSSDLCGMMCCMPFHLILCVLYSYLSSSWVPVSPKIWCTATEGSNPWLSNLTHALLQPKALSSILHYKGYRTKSNCISPNKSAKPRKVHSLEFRTRAHWILEHSDSPKTKKAKFCMFVCMCCVQCCKLILIFIFLFLFYF